MKIMQLINREILPAVILISVILAGCSDDSGNGEECAGIQIETGAIESDDLRDPDHSEFAYDSYDFEAETLCRIRVEVDTDGFSPLLKLVEISTGAAIAEWDPVYSTEDAMLYTIAESGSYEVRIYSLDDGTGEYTLTITMIP